MNSRFDYEILDAINNAMRSVKASPLNLGGIAGSGGGIGGPTGGIIGWLPQTRVAYDLSEVASSGIPESGMSLLDNLNHMRYRIEAIESGAMAGYIEVQEEGVIVSPAVTVLNFVGNAVTASLVSSGIVNVTVSGTTSSGGGTPGGGDKEIQFNDGGVFGGDALFTFDKATNTVVLEGDNDYGYIYGAASDTSFGLWIDGGASTVSGEIGGEVDIYGGKGNNSEGGIVDIQAGQGDGIEVGGSVYVNGGDGSDTFSDAGSVFIQGGWGYGAGAGGDVQISPGDSSLGTPGQIIFGDFPITPSAAPTTNYQVANKKYVDDSAGGHDAVTLDSNANTILSLSTQALGLDVQNANKVWAGPTTGADAVPSFRALVAGDIPALSYEPADATIVKTGNASWIDLTDGGATTLHSHAGGGDISGTGVAGQVAEFVTNTKTIQAAKLIGPAVNIITLTATAASTLALNVTAGKTVTLTATDDYNITIPQTGTASIDYVDTKANICAANKTAGQLAYSIDTFEIFVSLGSTVWRALPFVTVAESANPDMGALQGSSRIGYGTDYISDKRISNSLIGENARAEAGAIRTTLAGVFQVYLNGVWNDLVINFRLREDSAEGYEFEHKPVGFTEWIEIMSGNSNTKGLNGIPIVQGYKVSMGAYPVKPIISGGTF